MKTSLIFLFVIILCGAIIFISTTDLRSQTSRGMKISVRTSAGEHIELYNASYALVIGNGNYTNGWDLLPGALQDVKEVAQALKTHDFNVTLKTDLTADEFEDAFLTFVLEHGADENNRLLFYYAGHGYTLPLANAQERGYLVMIDAPEPDTDKLGFVRESVNMETLVGESKAILARHVLFLFDCCFSSTILNARDRISPESISDNIRHPVRQFITAGRANEPVPDRSVFKTAFLDLIDGRAAEPFRDGYITGAELGLYLKNQVPIYNEAQHPQYGKIRDPKLDKGDFVFVLPRHPSPPQAELPTLATVSVTSTPSGATVYLNGAPIGETPLRDYEIDTGIRRVKQIDIGLELAGYKSRVKNVTLIGGENVPWDVTLEPVLAPMIIGQDGAEMVLIPAGEFQMGSDDSDANDDEKPVHTVYVDAFYIDKYEVTNAQFKAFVDANPQWQKDNIPSKYCDRSYLWHWSGNSYPSGKGNHPVRFVSWYAAMAYAQWAGKRLPTEAEWEKAARGGLVGKKYPWGNAIDISQANYDSFTITPTITPTITSVGRYAPNGYGLYDMVGNVSEWCFDAYKEDFYALSPRQNPIAGKMTRREVMTNYQNVTTDRALRGGGWLGWAQDLRVADRRGGSPTSTHSDLGFRCARAVTQGGQEVQWDVQLEQQAIPQQGAHTSTIIGQDGAEMVLIPAGEFQMGSDDSDANDDEKPVHTVYVDAFYIDKYEVTNVQFKAFVDANPQWQKDNIPSKYHDGDYLWHWRGNSYPGGIGNEPVVAVSWYAAMAYAQWAGKRLPTEAEWEKAARGGLDGKTYPWGNSAPDGTQCNSADVTLANRNIDGIETDDKVNDRHAFTAPVGSYPANGYGLHNMAGNVYEWCLDEWDAAFYRRSPHRNPVAGGWVGDGFAKVQTHNVRVLRGGSWLNTAQGLRVATRFYNAPSSTFLHIGFRCARDITPTKLLEKQAPPKTNAMPDTSEMVLIPAGDFQMGSNDSNAEDHEKPVHTVYVDAFYIDKYEVTNAQFKAFVEANPQWQKDRIDAKFHNGPYLYEWNGNDYPAGEANHPVIDVSWYAAMAYAQWVGKRLPTEAEWEKAARGGLVGEKYPWGNVAPNGTQCNFADKNLSERWSENWTEIFGRNWSDENADDGYSITAPIGSYPPNGYGLYDMAGNAAEWCLDGYDAGFYRRSPRRNPLAGEMTLREVMTNYQTVTTDRVLRGGSWLFNARFLRVADRTWFSPTHSLMKLVGFRCARDVTPTKLLEKQAPPKANAMPDTSEMVLIPAGDFQMGSNDSNAEDNEKPVHTVYVDAFYINKYEVTNAQFKTFVDANPQWQKGNIPDKYHDGGYLTVWNGNNYPSGMGSDPVVGVSWYAAMAYAQWVGKRLPTEAEWEKAARGGLNGKKYPWGNVAPNGTQCNFADKNLSELVPNEWSDENVDDGYSIMAPIGSYPPNGYGLYDMAGNVWEWCLDAYEEDFYRRSPRRNPVAGGWVGDGFAKVQTHNARMFRGGAWNNPASSLRVSFRSADTPTISKTVIGFRCARDVTP